MTACFSLVCHVVGWGLSTDFMRPLTCNGEKKRKKECKSGINKTERKKERNKERKKERKKEK